MVQVHVVQTIMLPTLCSALNVLEELSGSSTRGSVSCNAALAQLLSSNLSAKYRLTGRLDSTDVLTHGFYDMGPVGWASVSVQGRCGVMMGLCILHIYVRTHIRTYVDTYVLMCVIAYMHYTVTTCLSITGLH